MEYGFIFGGAGTGKTAYIYRYLTEEALKHPEKKYVLFVPEQNTLRAQQELIACSKRHGMINLDVLSFQLLAYRVFEELGVQKPDILDEMSRSMLLRASCRKAAEGLRLYQGRLDQAGFIQRLKSAFSEFYQYDVTPEKLQAWSESTQNRLLSAKLSDLGIIFAAFNSMLSDRSTVAEALPLLLLRYLERSELLQDAELIFDGYTGFTPVQLRILGSLMGKAASLRFAVTIPGDAHPYRRDGGREAVSDLFWLSRETVAKVAELAEKNGLRRLPDISFSKTYCDPELSCRVCRDPKEEVQLLTEEIRRLMAGASEKTGLRLRDMAVAVSDPAGYGPLIREAFEAAGIPYFMDDKADGRQSVLAECVREALGVLREGYSFESVLRYLRNPLIQKDRDTIDCMDNYIRALGIRGRKGYEACWERTMRYGEALDLDRLNACREQALSPLFRLQDRMAKGSHKVSDRIGALLEWLSESGAAEALEPFCRKLEEAGFLQEAAENRRFYQLVLTLFVRMETVLGKEKLSLKEFEAVLSAGFTELKAGMIPEVMDRVVIGDLKRSRFDGIRVLFMLGMNDGLFPSAVSGGGIFTDREREELLCAEQAELAPADREDSCIQRFYLYLAMKKPRQSLCISYSRSDMQGKQRKPSPALADIREEAERSGRSLVRQERPPEGIFREEEGLLTLAGAFSAGRYEDRQVQTLYNLLRRRGFGAQAERLLRASAFCRREEKLDRETALSLYGETLYGSVTRLEQYGKCPFSHFLRYGLLLRERQEFDLAALDIGNLYHGAIEKAFRRLREEGKGLSELSEEALSQLAERCVEETAADYNNGIMDSSARNRYLLERVSRVTGRTLWALGEQFRRGDFRLYGCELPFCVEAEGMSLQGRIDRMDLCETESRAYVRVIDYKSGSTRFDLSLLFAGLQLQLAAYMNIAVETARAQFAAKGKEVAPAGIFYYHIGDPVLDYDREATEESRRQSLLRSLRLNGLASEEADSLYHMDHALTGEGSAESDVIYAKQKNGALEARGSQAAPEEMLSQLSSYAKDRMEELSGEILSGRIAVRPCRKGQDTACDFCPYHSVCGFDRRLSGYGFRDLRSVSKEAVQEELWKRYGKKEKRKGEADEMDTETAERH